MKSIYRPGGNAGPSNVMRHTVSGKQNFYEIDNLSGYPFYELWLTASTRAGIGDKSKVLRYSISYKGQFHLMFFNIRSFLLTV